MPTTHPASDVVRVLICGLLTLFLGLVLLSFLGEAGSPESPFKAHFWYPDTMTMPVVIALMLFFGWQTIAAVKSLDKKSK